MDITTNEVMTNKLEQVEHKLLHDREAAGVSHRSPLSTQHFKLRSYSETDC